MSRYNDDEDDDDDDDDRPRKRSKRRNRDDDDDDDYDDRRRDVGESKRMAAGICAILCGSFGVHKFILGYNNEGVILLTMTLVGLVVGIGGGFCCIFPFVLTILPLITGVIALVEGIIYLTKSDEEFIEMYQIRQKTWF